MVDCSLQACREGAAQGEAVYVSWGSVLIEGKMDHEVDKRTCAASALIPALNQTVVVKEELSQKA